MTHSADRSKRSEVTMENDDRQLLAKIKLSMMGLVLEVCVCACTINGVFICMTQKGK